MTMLDHDAVDEIGDSEDENDGDDVNDFHYGKHKTENNSKNKKCNDPQNKRVEKKL
jgi:hypothetical protein